jgi:two-component system sensor histidine kinase FlrB
MARIWEPFFTTKAEGTGLGLAIVRSLVRELGGTIQVERRGERGTLFRMTFPEAP